MSQDKINEAEKAFEAWLLDYKIREVSTPPRRIVWQAAVAWGRAQGCAEGYLAARKEVAAYVNKLFNSESDAEG